MTHKLKAGLAGGLGAEPTLIIQSVDAGLQVLQVTLVDVPGWVHAVIAAVIVVLSALVNRQLVAPVAMLRHRAPQAPTVPVA